MTPSEQAAADHILVLLTSSTNAADIANLSGSYAQFVDSALERKRRAAYTTEKDSYTGQVCGYTIDKPDADAAPEPVAATPAPATRGRKPASKTQPAPTPEPAAAPVPETPAEVPAPVETPVQEDAKAPDPEPVQPEAEDIELEVEDAKTITVSDIRAVIKAGQDKAPDAASKSSFNQSVLAIFNKFNAKNATAIPAESLDEAFQLMLAVPNAPDAAQIAAAAKILSGAV